MQTWPSSPRTTKTELHKKDDDYDPDEGDKHDPYTAHDGVFEWSEILPDPTKLYVELKDMVNDEERGGIFVMLTIFVILWSFWIMQFDMVGLQKKTMLGTVGEAQTP
jgi:hypothetical protein